MFLWVKLMLLRLAAMLALSLLIACLILVFVVEELKQRQKDPEQRSDVRSSSTEDIHRKTLEAAEALRGKQAESFLQHQQ